MQQLGKYCRPQSAFGRASMILVGEHLQPVLLEKVIRRGRRNSDLGGCYSFGLTKDGSHQTNQV